MDSLKDFYDFYRPLQRKYDLQMIYKTNSKETKITIRWRGKELVKVAEETTEACFIRAKRELEERMKKYEQQTETKEKAQRAGFYMDKISRILQKIKNLLYVLVAMVRAYLTSRNIVIIVVRK